MPAVRQCLLCWWREASDCMTRAPMPANQPACLNRPALSCPAPPCPSLLQAMHQKHLQLQAGLKEMARLDKRMIISTAVAGAAVGAAAASMYYQFYA